jgi:GTP1/Obg family GTP-binding protein
VADQVAQFIGRTLGELLNRKDALGKQMADVDRQIAEVRHRVVRQFGEYLPAAATRKRARKAARRTTGRLARLVSTETRQKMAEAARKRWARERAKKAKASKTK